MNASRLREESVQIFKRCVLDESLRITPRVITEQHAFSWPISAASVYQLAEAALENKIGADVHSDEVSIFH